MRHFIPTICLIFFCTALAWLAMGLAQAKEAEYKEAGPEYYLRASVLQAEPGAVIVGPGDYRKQGDSYFVRASRRPSKEIYATVMREWLEPITPPSMPASLGVPPDVMQIREPQGDVQVAPPDNPMAFHPATESMPIANGSIVKTGTDGTAAVLFGGVDSARLAPNSEAKVEQDVTPDLRTTRIDLAAGAAFSKVGLRPGEKQDYQVHTPFGVAAARGTDFVCVALPDRTDVWVAQGTVQFDQPSGQTVGTVKSSGKGTLQIIRFPVIDDPHAAMMATSQTMTLAMNFIPTVNLKVKTLRDQMAQGVKLTPQEKKYLSLMKHVPCLIKLELVEPPAPPPPPVPPPVVKPHPKAVMAKPAPPKKVVSKMAAPHAKQVKVAKKIEPPAQPAPVAKPVVVEPPPPPLPTAPTSPETPVMKPTSEDNSGSTAEPLNHMGHIMQMAPHEDFTPPRAQPVTPAEEESTTNTDSMPATNNVPHAIP